MNTDINPENVNPDDPEDINADTEDTQLMDAADGYNGAGATAELLIVKNLEDAVAPDSADSADDEPQAPKSTSSLKRKLVAGGVALAIVAALGIGLSLNHEAVNIPDNAPVASLVGGKEDAKTYPASVTL